jgi:hypothetical protein
MVDFNKIAEGAFIDELQKLAMSDSTIFNASKSVLGKMNKAPAGSPIKKRAQRQFLTFNKRLSAGVENPLKQNFIQRALG